MINKISREYLKGFETKEKSYIIIFVKNDTTFKVLINSDFTNQNNYINLEILQDYLNEIVDLKVSFKVEKNIKEITYNIPLTIKQICKLFNEIDNITINKYTINKQMENLKSNYIFGLSLRKKLKGLNYWCIINNNLAFKGFLHSYILGIEILGSDVFNEFNKNVNQEDYNFYISKQHQGKEVNFKASIKQLYNFFTSDKIDLETNKKYKLTNLSNNKNNYKNSLYGFYEYHFKEFRFKHQINNLVYRFKINREMGNIINNCFYFGSCLNDFENKNIDDLANEKVFILREIYKRQDKRSFKVSFNDLIKIFELKDHSHIETLEINKDESLIIWD